MYESLEDDYSNLDKVDESVYGFDGYSNNSVLGHFYIFLATIYNMIDLKLDRTPIIDSKGQVQGYIRYSLAFKILEPYGDVEIKDLIEYENLNELVGKKI